MFFVLFLSITNLAKYCLGILVVTKQSQNRRWKKPIVGPNIQGNIQRTSHGNPIARRKQNMYRNLPPLLLWPLTMFVLLTPSGGIFDVVCTAELARALPLSIWSKPPTPLDLLSSLSLSNADDRAHFSMISAQEWRPQKRAHCSARSPRP